MSGVMALMSLSGRPVSPELVHAQLATLTRYGIGEPAAWHGPGMSLGHVDPSRTPEAERETLPASDAAGRLWISWDGRLDNRDTLASLLGLDPARARAMTDAGYALAAYERWGAGCVEQLLGDWAFILWDAAERQLFCAKDPVGARPLFYARAAELLAVGSHVQQVLAGGFWTPQADIDYVARYLAGAVQRPGQTCYAGVHELTGGQTLTASAGSLVVHTYWSAPRITRRPYRHPMEYVEEFTQLFRLATRARLRTHQKVGVLLSGGLDSSYVAAVAALEGARLVAITGYAAQTTGMDERPFAKLIVQHLGIEWQTVDLSDCWSLSRRWLPDEVFDEAIHAPQSASHICLAEAARSLGVGVLLSGDGGDERMLERPGVLADAIKHGAFGYAWQHARTGCRSMHAVRRLVRSCYRQAAPFRIQDGIARLRHRANRPEYTPFVRWQSGWVDRAQARRALIWNPRQALRQEWQQYWQEDYPALRWRERHALAPNGIDLRAPFNDLRIVELMASTPEWVKRFQGRPKDLLRQAEYPILPAVIPDRDDNGEYGALLHAGVATHEQDRVCQGIEQLCRFPGLHAGSVKEEVQRWISTGEGQWAPSWRAMTVGLWLACSGVDVPAPGEAADAA